MKSHKGLIVVGILGLILTIFINIRWPGLSFIRLLPIAIIGFGLGALAGWLDGKGGTK